MRPVGHPLQPGLLFTGQRAASRRVALSQRHQALQTHHPVADLAWLAARAGYADHAHLVHDCRGLAGRTPSALLAQRATVDL